MKNFEVKAWITDPEAMERALRQEGAVLAQDLVQTDVYFHVPNGRLKLRSGDGRMGFVGYERADGNGLRTSDFTVYRATRDEALLDVLARALGVRTTVRKQRRVFVAGHVRFHLDRVDGLGNFLEIEIEIKDGLPSGYEPVSDGGQWLARLGIGEAQLVAESYGDLLEALGRKS